MTSLKIRLYSVNYTLTSANYIPWVRHWRQQSLSFSKRVSVMCVSSVQVHNKFVNWDTWRCAPISSLQLHKVQLSFRCFWYNRSLCWCTIRARKDWKLFLIGLSFFSATLNVFMMMNWFCGMVDRRKAFVDINEKLRDLCMKHNFEFIDHEQITSKFLWNDGIHLLDTGKSILGQNFVNRVSNFFRKNDSFLTDPHFQETIR